MDIKSKVSPPNEDDTKAVLGYPPKQTPLPPHLHYPGYPLPACHPHPGHGPPLPYPGGPPGYPNPGNEYHQYPSTPNYYQPPSHPGGYNSPQLPPHLEYEPRRSFAFARVILCLMVFLILGASIMSLLTYIVFGSDIPSFQVASFAVPSFNITDSSVTGKWEAGVTVENPNHKLDITFEQIEAGIGYHQVFVARKQMDPFEVKKNDKVVLPAQLSTPAAGYGDAGELWLKDMKSEYDDHRSVTFDLVLNFVATFKSGSVWSRRTMFKVLCAGLKTEFKDPGIGVWDGVRQGCMKFG